ncbi:hypothetical protein L198_07933 [Cryptococcus wingfieldii CBS 7118]|uniref:Uncharacterized protein n=1 Tax=Cryptococcus wingfieldii CBS 7118 TaxID=1295528 RepID=A0A1E3HRS9_9TREE|nr:hypothetical protein L198_07933 [Cryptococcus wingfieldii CBS 7118]ODN79054.1 hypothetical protein L198_07933 [Cryptococcus wingfieldii CBS 7118]
MLRHASGHVQWRLGNLPKSVGVWKKERFSVMGWLQEPLLASVSHVALGQVFESTDSPAPAASPLFGPSLKHICVLSPVKGPNEYKHPSRLWSPLQRELLESFVRHAPSFAAGSTKDGSTSLTLHNAVPGSISKSLADTMRYDMPRKDAWRRWKLQILHTAPVMSKYILALRDAVALGKLGPDGDWAPRKKPWRLCFTNIAPHPSRLDIPQMLIDDFTRKTQLVLSDLCMAAFRKWFWETVSFEGPGACECCGGVSQERVQSAPQPLELYINKPPRDNRQKNNQQKNNKRKNKQSKPKKKRKNAKDMKWKEQATKGWKVCHNHWVVRRLC